MSESILKNMSLDFAVSIIKLYKNLSKLHSEHELSHRLLRSCISPGALIREEEFAERRNDFKHN